MEADGRTSDYEAELYKSLELFGRVKAARDKGDLDTYTTSAMMNDIIISFSQGPDDFYDKYRDQIKHLATGGMHSGGLRVVGENGPELEATGPSRIYSAQQTKSLMSGGSGEVVQELRSLRREVSELKAEQRKVGVENVKYNKKSYDLYREWDTVGLPATRTA